MESEEVVLLLGSDYADFGGVGGCVGCWIGNWIEEEVS